MHHPQLKLEQRDFRALYRCLTHRRRPQLQTITVNITIVKKLTTKLNLLTLNSQNRSSDAKYIVSILGPKPETLFLSLAYFLERNSALLSIQN